MKFKRKGHIIMASASDLSDIELTVRQNDKLDHRDIKRIHNSEFEKNPRIEFETVNRAKFVSRTLQSNGHTCEVVK